MKVFLKGEGTFPLDASSRLGDNSLWWYTCGAYWICTTAFSYPYYVIKRLSYQVISMPLIHIRTIVHVVITSDWISKTEGVTWLVKLQLVHICASANTVECSCTWSKSKPVNKYLRLCFYIVDLIKFGWNDHRTDEVSLLGTVPIRQTMY